MCNLAQTVLGVFLLVSVGETIAFAEQPAAMEQFADPTRPPAFVDKPKDDDKKVAPTLKLTSIIYSENRRVAVINGKFLMEGAQIDDKQILEIHRQHVLIATKDGEQKLALPRKSIKTMKQGDL